MFRTSTLLRAAVVAVGATALLTGCFAPPMAPPAPTETPKPEPDFGTIGESPVPIETGAPIEPVEPDTAGYTAVFDDLGVLTVTVPDDWTDVNGVPFTTDAGQEWASITVAPDVQGYLDSWDVSGLEIAATAAPGATQDQVRGLLDSITGIYDTCETVIGEATPYDDGFFQGVESAYEGCGTGDTVAFAIAALSADGSQVVFVRAQITPEYDANEVYEKVAATFDTSVGRSAARN